MHAYTRPRILFTRHLETIYPSLLRSVKVQSAERERITTPDDDFLDLDWYRQEAKRCVIISHGLEGNSTRSYILGMAKAFFQNGYDVLTWNYRGCGDEMNRQLRFYHSGATDDLRTVVSHAQGRYDEINLIGFSLGGNITLKYLGEGSVPEQIKKAVAISVPLNLHTSCLVISRPSNWIYTQRFLRSLTKKVKAKPQLKDVLDLTKLRTIKNLMEFDDHFTGPLHGFRDAIDYYTQCSSIHFLKGISTPTLIVNAQNDPFLSPDCYPINIEKQNPNITFESPVNGGHVGFSLFNENGLYWSEMRALSFIGSS